MNDKTNTTLDQSTNSDNPNRFAVGTGLDDDSLPDGDAMRYTDRDAAYAAYKEGLKADSAGLNAAVGGSERGSLTEALTTRYDGSSPEAHLGNVSAVGAVELPDAAQALVNRPDTPSNPAR